MPTATERRLRAEIKRGQLIERQQESRRLVICLMVAFAFILLSWEALTA